MGFPASSTGKESTCNEGDPSSIPGLGSSLEKGTAAHSSILAWRIPWTVQSMGWQTVGHDWVNFTFSLSCWFNEIRPECPFNSICQIVSFQTILFVFEKFELKGDKSTWSIFQETHTCFSYPYNLSSTSIPHCYKSKKGNTINTFLNSF